MNVFALQDMPEGAAAAAAGVGIVMGIVQLVIGVLMIASMWKVFTKAGKPGWACLVPIYNIIVMVEIAGNPIPFWYFFIPILNIYAAFVLATKLAERFGKSAGFGIGLLLLPVVFYPMLGLGSAQYQKA